LFSCTIFHHWLIHQCRICIVTYSKSGYENFFKNPGYFESVKKIEPLPPTEISNDARERLKSWGLNEEIDDLRNFTSQFRYDLCPEKLERLSKKKFEIYSKEENGLSIDYIKIPSFFDVKGRMDGQCGDISKQWIVNMDRSGLFKKIKKSLNESCILSMGTCFGLSKTHFCRKGSSHFWNILSLHDCSTWSEKDVFFDASFQKIMTKEESGYEAENISINIDSIINKKDTELKVGKIFSDKNGNLHVEEGRSVVLGVSSDFKYSYRLGFFKNMTDILPVLTCLYEDGSSISSIVIENDRILPNLIFHGEKDEFTNQMHHLK